MNTNSGALEFLENLKLADRIIVCGPSSSSPQSIQAAVRDLLQHFSERDAEKIYLLEDGS